MTAPGVIVVGPPPERLVATPDAPAPLRVTAPGPSLGVRADGLAVLAVVPSTSALAVAADPPVLAARPAVERTAVVIRMPAGGGSGTGTFPAVAAVPLSAVRVVYLDPFDGLARYADCDDPATAALAAGVTATAAAAGGTVQVRGAGPLADTPTWDVTGDPRLFLGPSGTVVQGPPPGAAVRRRVGSVSGPAAMIVGLGEPILKL